MQALEGDYLEKDTAEIYSMIPPNFRPERKIQVCEIDLPTLLQNFQDTGIRASYGRYGKGKKREEKGEKREEKGGRKRRVFR